MPSWDNSPSNHYSSEVAVRSFYPDMCNICWTESAKGWGHSPPRVSYLGGTSQTIQPRFIDPGYYRWCTLHSCDISLYQPLLFRSLYVRTCLVPVYCILSICLEPPILDFGWSTPCSASTCLQQQKRTKWIIRQPQSRTFCLFWFRILCSTSARADDVAACEWEGLIGGCTPKKFLRVHGVPPHPKLKITHKRTMIP